MLATTKVKMSGSEKKVNRNTYNISSLKRVKPHANGCNIAGNNSQHCWMLHVASFCTPCCMLLDVVTCCCPKFETGQTFQPTNPNISFVPWSSKRSASMLDPFAQLFQHCWGHARSLRMDCKDVGVAFFPRCTAGPKLVGSCCIRLHTTANTHATIPNIVGARLHAALLGSFWKFYVVVVQNSGNEMCKKACKVVFC